MRVNVYKKGDTSTRRGKFVLIYGPSGSGKSATTLQTADDPIFWLIAERGNIDLTLEPINRPGIRLAYAYYEGWDDLIDTVYSKTLFTSTKTLLFDGFTHIMGIHLSDEIMKTNFDARDTSKDDKELFSRVQMTQQGFGVLSKQMGRLMKGFEQLTIAGVDVICTARDDQAPKWNRSLSCAPALSGKEFSKDMKGYFDFIGMLEPRKDENGKTLYPSYASYDLNDDYLAKWTGIMPDAGVKRLPFHVAKTFALATGQLRKQSEE